MIKTGIKLFNCQKIYKIYANNSPKAGYSLITCFRPKPGQIVLRILSKMQKRVFITLGLTKREILIHPELSKHNSKMLLSSLLWNESSIKIWKEGLVPVILLEPTTIILQGRIQDFPRRENVPLMPMIMRLSIIFKLITWQ